MLSNKLTFSLASLVVLLIAALCLPVAAQTVSSPMIITLGDLDAAMAEEMGFAVYAKLAAGPNIVDPAPVPAVVIEATTNLPNLEEFFRFGGTIELVVGKNEAVDWHELVISEIMWALDTGVDDEDSKQWIELYNASGEALDLGADGIEVHVIFTPFGRPAGDTANQINHVDGPDTGEDVDLVELGLPANRVKSDVTYTHKVIDRVSNIEIDDVNLRFRSRWTIPGQNGRTSDPADVNQFTAGVPLISANRKINYSAAVKIDGVPAGHESDKWEATDALARRNTSDNLYQSNPGTGLEPVEYVLAGATPEPLANRIVINEVHNNSDNDLDWIEIKNVMEPGSEGSDINIENWEIAQVENGKEVTKPIVNLPKFVLGAQEILLIVSRDPGETILAGGVDIVILNDQNQDQLEKGATHRYFIQGDLEIPDPNVLLLLRDNHEKNAANEYHNNIQDAAGGYQLDGYNTDRAARTEVFPFKNYVQIADADRAVDLGKENNTTAWARKPKGVKAGYYVVENTNGRALAAWNIVTGGAMHGLGYDRGVDLDFAPGSPGYENMIANTVDDFVSTDPDPDGMEIASNLISISEIMYDAGPRWNQVQWIELHNASMTQAVNIAGWELEIRNATDAVESYVDSSFIFEDAVILPNQTLLIVSGPGAKSRNLENLNRVYNLYENHRRELGLTTRRSVLLSPDGFYLKLTDKADFDDSRKDEDVIVDDAGNVTVDGATRTVSWELPPRAELGEDRFSLVRQYGTRGIGGADAGADDADDGTADGSWMPSDIRGAGLSYYGHINDIGTPGFRLGGPLPVSLASFRPVRDKATGEVVIRWITQSELNNAGFNILRAESKDSEFQVINLTGIIAGHGTTSEKHVYSYTDKTAKPNVAYYYQIEDVSLNGHRTTLQTTHMRGNVNASGKLTTTWSDLKLQK